MFQRFVALDWNQTRNFVAQHKPCFNATSSLCLGIELVVLARARVGIPRQIRPRSGPSLAQLRHNSLQMTRCILLSSCDLLSIYICTLARLKRKDDDEGEETERRRERKSLSRRRVVREKVEFGCRAWAKGPLDFVSVDECWIYFVLVFWSFVPQG